MANPIAAQMKRADTTEVAEALLPRLACQQALQNPLGEHYLCKIYGCQGWQVEYIAKAPGIITISSLSQLDQALMSAQPAILVRLSGNLSLDAFKNALRNVSGIKTIYFEIAD